MLHHPRILVVHASRHGHSRRIAWRVGGRLEESGVRVRILDVAEARDTPIGAYGGFVVVAAVHERTPTGIAHWMSRHRSDLERRPTLVLAVSVAAGGRSPDSARVARDALAGLLRAAGTRPALAGCVGGALEYERAGLLGRRAMDRLARRHGLPTGARRDVDLTDWAGVDADTDALLQLLDDETQHIAAPPPPEHDESGEGAIPRAADRSAAPSAVGDDDVLPVPPAARLHDGATRLVVGPVNDRQQLDRLVAEIEDVSGVGAVELLTVDGSDVVLRAELARPTLLGEELRDHLGTTIAACRAVDDHLEVRLRASPPPSRG